MRKPAPTKRVREKTYPSQGIRSLQPRPDPSTPTVSDYGYSALSVRAVSPYTQPFISPQNQAGWMAELVAPAHGDNPDKRLNRLEEFPTAGSLTALMGNLQNFGFYVPP